jgi:AraC family transcriptional regulator, transcriptional activator of pobA
MNQDIPVHQLQDRVQSGLDIRRFRRGDVPAEVETLGAHRDDHYLFFLLESGTARLMIDFQQLSFPEASLYYILPGQVHHRLRNQVAEGWFLAVDTSLVSPEYRHVFESQLLLQQPFPLNPQSLQRCQQVLCLLEQTHRETAPGPFQLPIAHSLLDAFIGMAAGCYSQGHPSQFPLSRPEQLARQFKRLLREKIRLLKSPSAYAAELHISESYLNEALKKVTGLPVSYWILQEAMLEAKRLLHYSQLNVKEIAHTLGYDDHAYFSRLFKKATGTTALDFRARSRK